MKTDAEMREMSRSELKTFLDEMRAIKEHRDLLIIHSESADETIRELRKERDELKEKIADLEQQIFNYRFVASGGIAGFHNLEMKS